jgi:gliding motility-associated-like protein
MRLSIGRILLFFFGFLTYGQLSGQCAFGTPTVIAPSCVPGCDGSIIISLPAFTCFSSPTPTAYNVIVNSPAGCNAVSGLSAVGPGTHTLTSVCSCTAQYGIIYFDDQSNFLGSTNVAVAPTTIGSFTLGATTRTIACNGACTGSTQVNFVGGTSPYSFTVTPPVPSSPVTGTTTGAVSATSLCTGQLTVNVVDTKGCTAIYTTFFNQPAALNTGSVVSSLICFGDCNAGFTITPSGGSTVNPTPQYTVNFNPGGTFIVPAGGTTSLTGLCSSTTGIVATVTDFKGCTAVAQRTVTQPPLITITPSQTNISCGGTCSGIGAITVTGGVTPYTYTWSPGPGTAAVNNSLCVGGQTVTLTDNLGCVRNQTFSITQIAPIVISPSITNVTCNGGSNGSATVSASGGTGAKTFTWVAPGNSTISTTSSASSLSAGVIYTVFASDAVPCFTQITVSVNQPTSTVTGVAVTQSVTCPGVCNGAATITPAGGNGAPYTYTWSPSGGNASTASGLCAQVYNITIKDQLGCSGTATANIIQPNTFTPNITTTSLNCNGACNGVINAAPSGGTGPYTFSLTFGVTSVTNTTGNFTGLCGSNGTGGVGTYTLRIADNTFPTTCAQTFTRDVLQPANPLAASINVTSVSCNNSCDGVLTANASGGTSPYTFSWTTTAGGVSGATLSAQCPSLSPHTLTITDARSCIATASATLINPAPITISFTSTPAPCSGTTSVGSLQALAGGGVPGNGYGYNWQPGNFTTAVYPSPTPGTYTLTVTNGVCSRSQSTMVTSPSAMTVAVSTTSTSCNTTCDGSATITITGGTGPVFTYSLTSPITSSNTTGIFSGLCGSVGAGLSHNGQVRDNNGCQTNFGFSIASPSVLTSSITGIKNSCTFCSGAATVTAAGGTGPYTYSWTSGAGTNSTISGACPTATYSVRVTDSRGCVASPDASVTIGNIVIIATPTLGASNQCFGDCNATATVGALGGTSPYTFSWSPASLTGSAVTGLCANSYTINVNDSGTPSCIGSTVVTVTQPSSISINFTGINATCFNSNDGSITTTVSGGPSGTYTYSWSPGGMTTASVSNLTPQTYTLRVTSGVCTRSITIPITSPGAITGTISAASPSSCAGLPTGSISITAAGGNTASAYTYSWNPTGATTSVITGLSGGAYVVTVTNAGCTNTFMATLSNPSGPTITLVSQQSVTCFNGNNGAATFSASGAAPFSFTWNPAGSVTSTSISTTGTGLQPGTYIVTMSGTNNCPNSGAVVIAGPSSITLNGTVTNVSCNGLCNGSIIATASETPASTYNFTWFPSGTTGTGTSASINSLCANSATLTSYTLVAMNTKGCTQTATFAVTEPPVFSLTAVTSSINCFGVCSGSITVTPGGGSTPYTYTWLPVGSFTGSSSQNLTNLCPGVYTLNTLDANNCPPNPGINTFTISEPTSSVTSIVTVTNETCFNVDDGIAVNTVTGGTTPYTYSWTSSASTTSISTNIPGGTSHTATVTDVNGCVNVQTFTIQAAPLFTIALTGQDPSCNNICNGSITSTIGGAQGTVSYVWSPTGTGPNPVGLCGGAAPLNQLSYSVTVTDAMGCTANNVVTLNNPAPLTAVLTTTAPTCNSLCDGMANAVPQNAVGTPTITWSAPTTVANTFTGLCGGASNIYSLNVVDGNNCQFSTTFTLTDPPALSVNASAAPATCGSNNGSITVVGIGGTAPYTFTWMPGALTGPTQNSLSAGIYSITVIDNSGCSDTTIVVLSNSNGPSATVSFTNVLCNGDNTGAIQVGPISSGAPTLQPVWILPPPTFTGHVRSNVPAGNYTVQLEDANGCITFTGATISQPPPISASATFSMPLCVGVCNGSISLNVTGGASPGNYTYSWTPNVSTTSVVTSACGGNYVIVITDTNSCNYVHTLNLPGLFNMVVQQPISKADNLCYGACAGSATVNVIMTTTGGTAHTAAWSNSQVGDIATGLCNNTHSVTITDTQGCMNTFTVPIVSPSQINVTSSVSQPSCGLCNGSVDVVPSGGTGPNYTFLWTTSATTSSLNNLCAGLYQVQVTDVNNCSELMNVAINNSSGITGENFNVQHVNCGNDCNGSATINPVGGTAPITFNWINPSLNNSTNTATALCAGNYFVQMTDAQNCIRTASVTINAGVTLTVSAFVTPPDCATPNGSVTAAVAGGALPYTYSWNPTGSTAPSINGIGAGNYTVTVTENGGCSSTSIVSVSNPNGPVINFTAQQDADCGLANGSLTVGVVQTTTTPFFLWSTGGPGIPTNTSSVNNLTGGVVTVTINAGTGPGACVTVRAFSINSTGGPEVSSHVSHPLCNSDCNGEITVLPVGGTLPYTFTWTPNSGTANIISGLCTGSYTATIIDAKGCSVTAVNTLTNPPIISTTLNPQNPSCANVADGAVTATISGGNTPFTYTWTGSGGFSANTPSVSNVPPGTYTLNITDSLGCTGVSSTSLVSLITNSANAGPDVVLCSDSSVVLSGAGSTGFGSISYRWMTDPNEVPGPPFVSTPTIMLSQVTQTTTMYLETMIETCVDRDTVVVSVFQVPFLNAGPTHTVPVFSQVTIGGSPTSAGIETLTWTPAENLDDPHALNPVVTTTNSNLSFTVSINYGDGCVVSDSVNVFLYPEIVISSGFTPNSDGKNDTWIIQFIDQFPNNTVEIYNRWGELLFKSNGYEVPFDGKYKGRDLPVGTYYYVIHLNHHVYNKPYTGPVTIFR